MEEGVKDYIKGMANLIEKLKPFIAIIMLVVAVLGVVNLIKYVNIQEEIKISCGYEKDEKVYCVCDKDFVKSVDLLNNPYYEEPTEAWDSNTS